VPLVLYRCVTVAAASGALVAQQAVEQQIDRHATADAEERRLAHALTRQRFAGFSEIDVPAKLAEGHCLADVAIGVEKGLAQFAETEAATQALDALALGVRVAQRHALHPLGGVSRAIFRSISTRMNRRLPPSCWFKCRSAWPVVPLPPNESRTRSPGLVAI